jgi:O-antigen/teichoic acid export membrane protein
MQIATLFLNQVGRIGFASTARHTAPDRTAAERLRFLTKYVLLMAGMGALIGLPCVLFSKGILLLFFRPEYVTAAGTLRLLGFYPVLYGIYLPMLQYVISARLQKTYFVVLTITGLLAAILCLWLIPLYQSEGAALSLVISVCAALVLFPTVIGLHLRRLSKVSQQGPSS